MEKATELNGRTGEHAEISVAEVEVLRDRLLSETAERKRTGRELRESERKYRDLMEALSDIYFEADRQGNVTKILTQAPDAFGYTTEDVEGGLNVFQVLIPEDRETFLSRWGSNVLNKELETVRNYRIIRKDGNACPVIAKITPMIRDDEVIGMKGIVTDLAELRKALEAHRSEERRYRDLVENLNDIIYSADLAGRLTFVSPPIEALTGYHPSEMIGRLFSDFIHPEDLPRIGNQFERIISGVIEPSEYRIMAKSGKACWVRSSSRAIYTDSEVTGIQGVVTDITERRKVAAALKEREQELIANSRKLAEINTAMQVLLRQRQDDREEFEHRVLVNVSELIMPNIEKLKKSCLDKQDLASVLTIESRLKEIGSSFAQKLTRDFDLSPKEIQIANYIREGRTSKDIAESMRLSKGTVDLHRNHIRKKLGIGRKKSNLKYFLTSIL